MAGSKYDALPSAGSNKYDALPEAKSALGTMADAAGNSAMLGYGPQVVGAAGSILDSFLPPVIDPKTGKAIPRMTYNSAKMGTVGDLNESQKQNPKSYLAGSLIGGAAPAILTAPLVTGVGSAAAVGAGIGALSNPGDSKDSGIFQLKDRALNAGLGGIMGAGGHQLGQSLGDWTRQYGMYKRMQAPEGLARDMQGHITSSLDNFSESQIAPQASLVKQLAKQGSVELDPVLQQSILKKLPHESRSMYQNAGKDAYAGNLIGEDSNMLNLNQGSAPAPVIDNIPGDSALSLRQQLDELGRYSKQRALSGAANPGDPEAADLANILRNRISKINPDINPMQDSLSKNIRLRNDIQGLSDKPMELLKSAPGSTTSSLLSDLDKGAGSNLSGLGADLRGGQKMFDNGFNFANPMSLPGSAFNFGKKGAAAMLGGVSGKLPNGTKETILNMLLEEKRRALSR